ncbi:hypothetical protein AAMO2058_001685200 [Amorphochlora amoebiformis]|mmetsp:Transcript_18081/g.28797  ORF Transcript_18081/g.28797 Transcript_18081/m.28797 type:complete len:620 (-) Transcript_18081:164-2023(-)
MPTTTSDAKYAKLNALLSQTSAYSEFLINKVPEKLRKQLTNTTSKVSSSFEMDGDEKDRKKIDVANHPYQKLVKGGTLRDYQLQGVEWLAALYQNGLNGILADEMGLGKTIQVVTFIGHLRAMQVYGPIMIVAPLSTLQNWVKEFKKWLPDCAVCYYHGTKQERAAIRKKHFRKQKDKTFPVVVTSFELTIIDKSFLSHYTWVELIVDEGHRLKNMDCKLIKVLKQYNSQNRLLLTGTPLQNNLRELWSLLNFLLPTIFDNVGSFENWFNFTIDDKDGRDELVKSEKNNQVLTKLHEILRPFVLRRLKINVLDKLPEKKEIVVYPAMTEFQRVLYKSIVEKKADKLGLKFKSLQNSLMQLRKVCNHPFLIHEPEMEEGAHHTDESIVTSCGKLKLLDRMLKRLLENKHKVLIFSQMTRMLDILQDYCSMRGWKTCRIDGSMSADDRQDQMERFQTLPRYNVFLLSTRAGGLGVNLTAADTCIIYDSDWNPHQDSQAQDRCHRFGQKNKVMVYRFITPNSVEEHLLKRASSKRKLEKLVIQKGNFNKRRRAEAAPRSKLTLDDLKEVFEHPEGHHKTFDKEISDKDVETLLNRDSKKDEGEGFRVFRGHSGFLGFLMKQS